MHDFEAFQAALATHAGSRDAEGEPTYMNSLMNSMSLVLEEFYKHLTAVGVSSYTGAGIKEFFDAVEASRTEYEKYVIFNSRSTGANYWAVSTFLNSDACRPPARRTSRRRRRTP